MMPVPIEKLKELRAKRDLEFGAMVLQEVGDGATTISFRSFLKTALAYQQQCPLRAAEYLAVLITLDVMEGDSPLRDKPNGN
jgi:hypothetical protein